MSGDSEVKTWVEDRKRIVTYVEKAQNRDPTILGVEIRKVAKRLRLSQTRVHEIAEDTHEICVNTALGIGSGHYNFERIGDYLLEVL